MFIYDYESIFIIMWYGIVINIGVFFLNDVWSDISRAFSDALSQMIRYLPRAVGAVIIVLIGYLIGLLARSATRIIITNLLQKPLEKTKFGKSIREAGIDLGSLIGNLVLALVIAVSLVAAVDILQIGGYAGQLAQTIARAILNLTAGATILAIGLPLSIMAAEFISSLMLGPFKDKHELAYSLVYDVTALVLSVFVIALAVNVMFQYTTLLDVLVMVAPGFIGASIILFIGYILGDAVGKVVNKIVENVAAKPLESTDIGVTIREAKIDLPGLIGGLTKAFIIVVSVVAAVEILRIGGLTGQLTYQVALYLPRLIGGIAILTLGLILSIILVRYIGKLIRTVYKDRYGVLADIAENLILLGLLAVVLTIALNTLELQGSLVYALILGVVVIISGIYLSEIIGQLLKESHPTYARLTPFIESIILLVFMLIGVAGIFSQFTGVERVISVIAVGLSIAFAIILIPIAFHYTRLAWKESGEAFQEAKQHSETSSGGKKK